MKITCETDALKKALEAAISPVDKRSLLPIARNFRLDSADSTLKITGTNTETTVVVEIPAKIEEEGSTTIAAHFFSDFVHTLTVPSIVIDTTQNENSASIIYNGSGANIATADPDDFPETPKANETTVSINQPELRAAIERVEFSASKESSRPVLTATRMELSPDTLRFTSADGYRMSVYSAPCSPHNGAGSGNGKNFVMVPTDTLKKSLRIFRDAESEITIGLDADRKHISLSAGPIAMTSKLNPGTPPNFDALIPTDFTTGISLMVAEMSAVTKNLGALREDENLVVRLTLDPDAEARGENEEIADNLTMTVLSDIHGQNTAALNAAVEGPSNHIAFKNDYVMDLLNVMDRSANVRMEITNDQTQALFKEISDDGESVYSHILMPMFVEWNKESDEENAD